MGRFWTQPERTFLSACQDICGKLKLDAQKTIPKLLADRGIDRTWKGICYALSSRIPVCEFQEKDIEENRRLVYEALSRLQLISPNAMGDSIVVSDAEVDKWRRTGVAHDFSEVCGTKRAASHVNITERSLHRYPAFARPSENALSWSPRHKYRPKAERPPRSSPGLRVAQTDTKTMRNLQNMRGKWTFPGHVSA
jgi:hypothetical protein